jgi:Uncharacterized protein conserved in bacteria
MELLICFFIFLAKVIETALATFRIIIIASGRKIFGAILSGIISVVWIISTMMAVVDMKKYPLRVIFFAIGCFAGSYLGSIIEEKMAMGDMVLMIITDDNFGQKICEILKEKNFEVTFTKGNGQDNTKNIVIAYIPRKERMRVTKIIRDIDNKAIIISENANLIS